MTSGRLRRSRLLQTRPLTQAPKKLATGGTNEITGVFYGTLEERIEWMSRKIMWHMRKYSPAMVEIEGYSFSSNDKGMRDRCEYTGVVKHHLRKNKFPFILTPPSSLKLYATGNGHASKEEMIEAAIKAGFKAAAGNKGGDLADAYWLADHAWNMALGNLDPS